jgi:fibro-slime domain-containing protein
VQGSVNLDSLGLIPGVLYPLDVFHAERCGSGSNFRIDTSIGCIMPQ